MLDKKLSLSELSVVTCYRCTRSASVPKLRGDRTRSGGLDLVYQFWTTFDRDDIDSLRTVPCITNISLSKSGLDGVDCGWLRPDFGHKMSFDLAQFFVSIREFVNTCDVKYRSYDFMDAGDAVRRFDVIIMSLSVILDNCHVHRHVPARS